MLMLSWKNSAALFFEKTNDRGFLGCLFRLLEFLLRSFVSARFMGFDFTKGELTQGL